MIAGALLGALALRRNGDRIADPAKISRVRLLRCGGSSLLLRRAKCRAGDKKKQIAATRIAPRCDMRIKKSHALT
jgi:hypothetical protein